MRALPLLLLDPQSYQSIDPSRFIPSFTCSHVHLSFSPLSSLEIKTKFSLSDRPSTASEQNTTTNQTVGSAEGGPPENNKRKLLPHSVSQSVTEMQLGWLVNNDNLMAAASNHHTLLIVPAQHIPAITGSEKVIQLVTATRMMHSLLSLSSPGLMVRRPLVVAPLTAHRLQSSLS